MKLDILELLEHQNIRVKLKNELHERILNTNPNIVKLSKLLAIHPKTPIQSFLTEMQPSHFTEFQRHSTFLTPTSRPTIRTHSILTSLVFNPRGSGLRLILAIIQ